MTKGGVRIPPSWRNYPQWEGGYFLLPSHLPPLSHGGIYLYCVSALRVWLHCRGHSSAGWTNESLILWDPSPLSYELLQGWIWICLPPRPLCRHWAYTQEVSENPFIKNIYIPGISIKCQTPLFCVLLLADEQDRHRFPTFMHSNWGDRKKSKWFR